MRERLKSLKQLLLVYEAIEEMREVESERAATEVREAEQAIGRERRTSRTAALYERQALATGDRLGRSLAAAEQEAAGWRQMRLEGVLSEREERSSAAQQQHMDSRQWSERMKRLVDGAEASVTEMDERRMQAAADDRFLSRKGRKRRRGSNDAAGEMNAS